MRRKAVITAISLALLVAPAATAADFGPEQETLDEYKDIANQNSDRLPDFVKNLAGNQDINVYIDRQDAESYNLSIQTNSTMIENVEDSSLDQPDIETWTSTRVIENVSESDQPVERIKTAINEEDIEYQANDTWTKIKLFFAETFMNF
jgi:hypothetical protein